MFQKNPRFYDQTFSIEEEIELYQSFLKETAIKIIYQNFYDKLIIVSDHGCILIFDTTQKTQEIRHLFKIRTKIVSCALSPNEEFLIVVTEDGEIHFFDKFQNFDNSVNIFDSQFESEKLNILQTNISWRFDSSYFNIVYQTNKGTKSITYTKELKLEHSPSLYNPEYPLVTNTFEEYDKNLLPFSAFSQNGAIIAGVNNQNKSKIVLWERNGLYYDEFETNEYFKDKKVKEIFWSVKEQMLFLHLVENENSSFVIYMRSNGIWNLKGSLSFQGEVIFKIFVKNDFFVFTHQRYFYNIFLNLDSDTFQYTHSQGQIAYGLGIFNQNNELAITPYNMYKIPPPLSFIQVKHNLPIKCFTFDDNNLFFIDFENNIYYTTYSFPNKLSNILFICKLNNNENIIDMKYANKDNEKFLLILTNQMEKEEKDFSQMLMKINLEEKENQFVLIDQQNINLDQDKKIDSMQKLKNEIYFFVNNSEIYYFNNEIDDLEHVQDIEFDTSELEGIKICKLVEKSQPENEEISFNILIIDNFDTLYFNQNIICKDCTSFQIYKQYFLFTLMSSTPYDQLYFQKLIDIENGVFERPTTNKLSNRQNLIKRNIEKNATIVCCSNTEILFQLPRGNFETIHHRILLIEEIKALVSAKSYFEAFLLIRKHKLNSNLLIDLNIEGFCEYLKTGKFLNDFTSKCIDIFTLDLTNNFSDELQFIFSGNEIIELKNQINQLLKGTQKVNYICEKMEQEMEKDELENILHLMVIYSKKNPRELQKGLRKIKQLKSQTTSVSVFKKKPPHLVNSQKEKSEKTYKDVLKYFSWLVDASQIYKLSLSLYDLEMAIMVAEFTHMDPKEYLPYIEQLKNIKNPIDFKSKVCLDMRNYPKAIEELSKGSDEQKDQALSVINEQKLFVIGLKVFKDDERIQKQVKKYFGEYFYSKKNYKNASLFLQQFLECHDKVQICYEKTLDWQNGYEFMKKNKKSDQEIEIFLNQILKSLLKKKAYEIMIPIYNILKQPLKEAVCSIKSSDYKNVKLILNKNQFTTKEKSEIVKELEIMSSIENNKIVERINNNEKWTKRLKIVQERKEHHKLQGIDDDALTMMSDITSVNSFMTGTNTDNFSQITGMTKFNIRKNKKPKNLSNRRYKENSVYEEEWLVESLNKIDINKEEEKNLDHLFSLLLYLDLVDQYQMIKKEFLRLVEILTHGHFYKTLKQKEFEEKNHELFDLYNHLNDFDLKKITPGKKRKFDLEKKYKDVN